VHYNFFLKTAPHEPTRCDGPTRQPSDRPVIAARQPSLGWHATGADLMGRLDGLCALTMHVFLPWFTLCIRTHAVVGHLHYNHRSHYIATVQATNWTLNSLLYEIKIRFVKKDPCLIIIVKPAAFQDKMTKGPVEVGDRIAVRLTVTAWFVSGLSAYSVSFVLNFWHRRWRYRDLGVLQEKCAQFFYKKLSYRREIALQPV